MPRQQNDTTALAAAVANRPAQLLASLSRRCEGWAWRPVYERWMAGEPTSRFHRKWLALSVERIRRRASGRDEPMTHQEVARVRLWPERRER